MQPHSETENIRANASVKPSISLVRAAEGDNLLYARYEYGRSFHLIRELANGRCKSLCGNSWAIGDYLTLTDKPDGNQICLRCSNRVSLKTKPR